MPGLLRSIFSFEGRINRTQFLVRFGGLSALVVAYVANDKVVAQSEDVLETVLGGFSDIVVFFTLAWCFWANSAKRWHDSDVSGLYVLINIVPVVGVPLNFLLNVIIPGSPGTNRFGNPS